MIDGDMKNEDEAVLGWHKKKACHTAQGTTGCSFMLNFFNWRSEVNGFVTVI